MANSGEKELVWLHGEIKTSPLSREARLEAGFLLRKLQQGEMLSLPQSRPVPGIGTHCHELRIVDANSIWRVVYRIDSDAIVILEVFSKKTREMPQRIIDICRRRLKAYDEI